METVMITGGGGRMGRAAAQRLVADGWRVVLADIDLAAARAAASTLGDLAQAIQLDVTRLADVKAAVGKAVAQSGPIGALVNAAGGRAGAETGPFMPSEPSSWPAIIDLHLRGVINCCHAVLPGMMAAARGSIVSIAAVEGLRGDPAGAVFSAAKAGVIVLTETLVRECQPHGIRVNAVLPGHPRALAAGGGNDDAGDVAEAVAFLVSDRAGRTTGSCLDVSGGWALH